MELEEYYLEKSSLYENVEELVDIDEDKRNEINILILNIVIKYLTSYLLIKETNILQIKEKVHSLLEDISIVRGFDNMAMFQGNKSSLDSFGLDCLFDIKQTSAIFKEIAFDGVFDESDVFKSLDLGSGTGILTLATYIAGKRKKCKKGEIFFVDQSEKAIGLSSEIFKKLIGDYKFYGKVGDITNESTYNELSLKELSYLVSETIGNSTPSFSLDSSNGELYLDNDFSEFLLELMNYGDPFPNVMSLLTKMCPELYQKIKKGRVGMFPNFPRKLYIPNDSKSTLILKTSPLPKQINLGDVGLEFECFEDLGLKQKRWSNKLPKGIEEIKKFFDSIFIN